MLKELQSIKLGTKQMEKIFGYQNCHLILQTLG